MARKSGTTRNEGPGVWRLVLHTVGQQNVDQRAGLLIDSGLGCLGGLSDRVRQSGEPVDQKSLCGEQDCCNFNDKQ